VPAAGDPSQVVSIRFPEELYRAAKAFAALAGEPVNAVVVAALAAYLQEHAGDDAAIDTLVEHRHGLRSADTDD
jgi:hypothetical protein